jgi:hypothetical protein
VCNTNSLDLTNGKRRCFTAGSGGVLLQEAAVFYCRKIMTNLRIIRDMASFEPIIF